MLAAKVHGLPLLFLIPCKFLFCACRNSDWSSRICLRKFIFALDVRIQCGLCLTKPLWAWHLVPWGENSALTELTHPFLFYFSFFFFYTVTSPFVYILFRQAFPFLPCCFLSCLLSSISHSFWLSYLYGCSKVPCGRPVTAAAVSFFKCNRDLQLILQTAALSSVHSFMPSCWPWSMFTNLQGRTS